MQKEDAMNERDIISAGIKVVGLFILLLGTMALLRDGASLVIRWSELSALQVDEVLWPIILPIYFTRGFVSITQIALGLYLCNGGKLFVAMLTRNTKDS